MRDAIIRSILRQKTDFCNADGRAITSVSIDLEQGQAWRVASLSSIQTFVGLRIAMSNIREYISIRPDDDVPILPIHPAFSSVSAPVDNMAAFGI